MSLFRTKTSIQSLNQSINHFVHIILGEKEKEKERERKKEREESENRHHTKYMRSLKESATAT